MRRFLIGSIAAIIIIPGLWQIAVTDRLITGLIEESLEDKGLHADITEFKKGFFFDFALRQITIKKSGKEILSIENAKGRLDLLSLFVLQLPVFFNGEIGRGTIRSKVELFQSGNPLEIAVDSAEIEDIPVFSSLGLLGRGTFSGNLKMENNTGEIRFQLADAHLKSVAFDGIMVPMELFYKGRGALIINGDTVVIKSFVLEGDSIYARIKGDITGGRSSLTLELMPEQSFQEKHPVLSLLERYRVSPGYYSIPITRNFSLLDGAAPVYEKP